MASTSEQLIAEAHRLDEKREESFQRCDTDGFLSQWAFGISAEKLRLQAKIADNEGNAPFLGLFDENNRRIQAKIITSTFNHVRVIQWLLHPSEKELIAKRGKRYLPYGDKSRILKNLGIRQAFESAPAVAKVMGSGTGLSGCASAYVGHIRAGCEWGSDATFKCEYNEHKGW